MSKKILGGREKVKAAVVQASPVFMDKGRTIEKACALIREAGRNNAELIAFSEAFIPVGYDLRSYYAPAGVALGRHLLLGFYGPRLYQLQHPVLELLVVCAYGRNYVPEERDLEKIFGIRP